MALPKKAELEKAKISSFTGLNGEKRYCIRTGHTKENGDGFMYVSVPGCRGFAIWNNPEKKLRDEKFLFNSSEIYYLIDEIVKNA
jgi:hypothetical protein